MKWFKHESNSIHEAKIEKLIQKHGVEGYGLYYACIELIAQRLSSDNIDFELHHDAETLAVKFKIDTLKVEEIMKFCIKEGLFQCNIDTNKIFCLRLLEMLDISTSNNPEIKKIKDDPNYKKLLDSNSRLDKIRLDENREDKKKEKKKKTPSLFEIKEYIEQNSIDLDAEEFYNKNEAIGWVTGKNKIPIKSWKHLVRTWEKNAKKWRDEKGDNITAENLKEKWRKERNENAKTV